MSRRRDELVTASLYEISSGSQKAGGNLNQIVRYNPATDTWVTLGNGSNFTGTNPGGGGRLHDIFYTWTGSEFMWMGFWNDGGNNAVYSYRPPRPAYLYAKP